MKSGNLENNKVFKNNSTNQNISMSQMNNNLSSNIYMGERKAKVIDLENSYKIDTGTMGNSMWNRFRGKKMVWNGKYTKAFEEYNLMKLKAGDTSVVAFDTNKLFDKTTNRLLNKKNYFTQKGKLRKKFQNDDYKINFDTFVDVNKYSVPLRNRISQAETKKDNITIPIRFDLLNNNLDKLLKVIKPTTKRYLLRDTALNKYYTLNDSMIEELRKIIDKGLVITEEEDVDSKMTILRRFLIGKSFELIVMNKQGKTKPDGSFFGYNHVLDGVDLKRYGVFSTTEELEDDGKYDINCICVALQNSGLDITPIKHIVKNRSIPHKDLKYVADTLGVYITLKYITDEKKKNHYGDRTKPEIKIGNIEKHYFLIEETNYTRYSILNYFEVRDKDNWNKIYSKEGKKYKRKNDRFIDSYKLIKILIENKDTYLAPIQFHNNLYKSCFYNEVDEFGTLDYDEEINTQVNPQPVMTRDKIKCVFKTIFFDFETTTRRDDEEQVNHKPYCVYTNEHPKGFHGENCGKKLIDELVMLYGVDKENENYKDVVQHKYQLRLIAHNCGYDFRFIMKYLYGLTTIEKGNSIMNGDALCYCGNKVLSINLRDSLKMINMGLGKFGKAFDLDVKKEILPYDLYTEERVKERYILKSECLKFVKDDDTTEYLKNCKKWRCVMTNKEGVEYIDIIKYSGEYCYMDCITLRDGYNKFKSLVQDATKQNIDDYISLASMSNDYLLNAGCYDGVMMLSGVPRHFIQKCVVGGRTMTAKNKKWIKRDCNVSDFDAVSLYPSAMNRMDGFLKGCPKVIQTFQPELYDGYFINIKITKIKKGYNFPCASVLTDKGIRHFTNDLVGKNIYMDKTGLEDLIKFQGVEYEFIKGYYYDEGRNEKIKETMKYLFTQRLKYKKQGNPIQMVFKELMNSSYGKTFMKPIDSDSKYIPNKDFEKFITYHYNSIKDITPCEDGKRFKIKLMKPIDNHFNNVPCGVEILSMSKRIMYEVMTLAEDNNYPVYITDTDSLHIDTECVPLLADKFKEKYNRELIGKGMGQFHTDFELDGSKGEIIATDCVFLGKKCYCDRLKSTDKDGKVIYGYHTRMKGIPNDCIVHKADTEFGGDIIALYEELYKNPEGLEFNLLACRPKFEYKTNMTIVSKDKFNRRVKFNYESGEIMYDTL